MKLKPLFLILFSLLMSHATLLAKDVLLVLVEGGELTKEIAREAFGCGEDVV